MDKRYASGIEPAQRTTFYPRIVYEKEKIESAGRASTVALLLIWKLLFGKTHGMMLQERQSVPGVVVWNCPGGALFVIGTSLSPSQTRVVKLCGISSDNNSAQTNPDAVKQVCIFKLYHLDKV